ncbi:hypothetical protein P2R98_23210, partial [Escherichia coli]
TVCVVGKMRDLILQLSKSSIYSTKPYNANRTYFKTIRKATLGYEQNIGDDWIAKIEYKHAWEKEHKNFYDPRDEEKYNVLNQDNIYVHAFYRF